jgi:hypothetical protein
MLKNDTPSHNTMPRRNYGRGNPHRLQHEIGWLFDSTEHISTPRQEPPTVYTVVPQDTYEVVARFASDPLTRIGRCLIINAQRRKAVIGSPKDVPFD